MEDWVNAYDLMGAEKVGHTMSVQGFYEGSKIFRKTVILIHLLCNILSFPWDDRKYQSLAGNN